MAFFLRKDGAFALGIFVNLIGPKRATSQLGIIVFISRRYVHFQNRKFKPAMYMKHLLS